MCEGGVCDAEECPLIFEWAQALHDANPNALFWLYQLHPGLLNSPVDSGYTLLHLAATRGQVEMATYLILMGADVNARVEGTGETPLLCASNYPAIVVELLNKGCYVDPADEYNKTPLMYVAWHNNLLVAKLLIQHGANVNMAGISNSSYTIPNTPLRCAVRKGLTEMVELLLKAGALVHDQFDAQQGSVTKNAAKAGLTDIVQLLVANGGDPNV